MKKFTLFHILLKFQVFISKSNNLLIGHYEMRRKILILFFRSRQVEENIISILRQRLEDCMYYERFEREKCRDYIPILQEAETNYFIKCKMLHIACFLY